MAILAPGTGIAGFEQASLPVVSARGQVSHLPAVAGGAGGGVPRWLREPAVDGLRCAGATFAVDDPTQCARRTMPRTRSAWKP